MHESTWWNLAVLTRSAWKHLQEVKAAPSSRPTLTRGLLEKMCFTQVITLTNGDHVSRITRDREVLCSLMLWNESARPPPCWRCPVCWRMCGWMCLPPSNAAIFCHGVKITRGVMVTRFITTIYWFGVNTADVQHDLASFISQMFFAFISLWMHQFPPCSRLSEALNKMY